MTISPRRHLLLEKIKKPAFVMPDGTKVYINKFGRWYYINISGAGYSAEIEDELTAALSAEMAREIDAEILKELFKMVKPEIKNN
jgi:hypothetical protein